MQYGLNIENQNLIITKSKTKKDGIYTFRGVIYRVYTNTAILFAYNGEILQNYGGFNCVVGRYDTKDEARKLMRGYDAQA